MTPKQEQFVHEYLVDLNASQAAVRAGYSENSARQEGVRLLSNANIADAIAVEQAKRRHRLEVSADRVVQEYARVAFANIRDFVTFGPDGVTIRDMDDLTPDQVAAVGEVTETATQTGKTVKFKLHDKLWALDALSKHLGLDAPQKVALTNAAGEDSEPADPVELARGLAFLLAKGVDAQASTNDAAIALGEGGGHRPSVQ